MRPARSRVADVPKVAGDAAGTVAEAVRAVAFWATIILPFAYVPLLYGGVGSRQAPTLLAVLALNLACAVVGRTHSP